MKKILMTFLAVLIALTIVPAAANPYSQTYGFERLSIEIDGVEVSIPEEYGAVVIVNGRTMVPVRFVSEHLGFDVQWIESEQMVMFMSRVDIMHFVAFQIGGYNLLSEGRITVMDVPAMLIGARSYIPIRFFAQVIGFDVDWDYYAQTVRLDRQ